MNTITLATLGLAASLALSGCAVQAETTASDDVVAEPEEGATLKLSGGGCSLNPQPPFAYSGNVFARGSYSCSPVGTGQTRYLHVWVRKDGSHLSYTETTYAIAASSSVTGTANSGNANNNAGAQNFASCVQIFWGNEHTGHDCGANYSY